MITQRLKLDLRIKIFGWCQNYLTNNLVHYCEALEATKKTAVMVKLDTPKETTPNYRDQNIYWCPFCEFYHTGGKVKFESANFVFDESIYSELIKMGDDSLRYELERYLQLVLTIQ